MQFGDHVYCINITSNAKHKDFPTKISRFAVYYVAVKRSVDIATTSQKNPAQWHQQICRSASKSSWTCLENFLNIQALMCVALMSILYNVGTTIRSLTGLETGLGHNTKWPRLHLGHLVVWLQPLRTTRGYYTAKKPWLHTLTNTLKPLQTA